LKTELKNKIGNSEFGSKFLIGSGNIESDYRLDDRVSIPGTSKEFFPSNLCVHTTSEAYPASYPMVTGDRIPGGKARPGRDADHSTPFISDVKNEYVL
jgi:hypothetical protein